jgi:2-iminobutanoate/2-iminopropanoate deaminase
MDVIYTERAPKPIGPYSQAIRAGPFLFVSGQLGIDPASGELIKDVEGQIRQALRNVSVILEEAGYEWHDVVKVTIYLNDMRLFPLVNKIYDELFDISYPARAIVSTRELPKKAVIEVDVVAYKEG